MIPSEMLEELKAILGDRVSTAAADTYVFGFDASVHHHRADAVVFPETTEEVAEVVRLCNRYRVPVTPRGSGSALAGQAVPIKGGISMSFKRMNRIKDVRVEDLQVIVEPGVINDDLNDELEKYGFFYPPSPGSGKVATIGGMVAMNASGMRALKYGATRDYVMALEVVMPTGEIAHFGTHTIKDASSYQMAKLMVGSEGTLGIITEITLRIAPIPRETSMILAAFDDARMAGQTISDIIAYPLIPASVEFMDRVCLQSVINSTGVDFPLVDAVVLIELEGSQEEMAEDLKKVQTIARKNGAIDVRATSDQEKMDEWLDARKEVLPSMSQYARGKMFMVSLADDMSLPISKIPDAVYGFHEIEKKHPHVVLGVYGHAGDGNLHTIFLIDPRKKEAWKDAEKMVEEMYELVIELGGTVSGEHGIGITKAPFMRIEKSDSMEIMKRIKRALDPNDIMNPGKNVEWDDGILVDLRYPVEGD